MYCNQVAVAYVSPTGYHRHRCYHCHTIWEHSNKMRGVDEAHICPNCGEEEWSQYLGDKAPTKEV